MNTFFALRVLSQALSIVLKDSMVFEIYRQTKQSVIFCFDTGNGHPFYIETFFSAEECIFHFPQEYTRSRKSVSLLKETWGKKVLRVEQAENERTFVIHLEDEFSIVFKWFGRQSNILLWKKGEVIWMLRNKLEKDRSYNATALHKNQNWSQETFEEVDRDLLRFIPQLGKETLMEWMHYSHWEDLIHPKDQWKKVKALIDYLQHPSFYLLQKNKRVRLNLFDFKEPETTVLKKEDDPIKAANAYFHAFYQYNRVEALRERLSLHFNNKSNALTKQITQLQQRILDFEHTVPPQQIADLIMANLHLFNQQQQAEVINFYTQKPLVIRIKEGMSAADYAGSLYKKSKNRTAEKANMQQRLKQLEEKKEETDKVLQTLEHASPHVLLQLQEQHLPVSVETKKSREAKTTPEFKTYEHMGFKIFVGRNARNNDELTLHFAHKEDLWLHAKDVSGSHVIVKYKAGQSFPQPVIERAAELAAFYSKRKTESLCPVMYTSKKYVRKVKGAAPGMVRVERERVILVSPKENL